MNNRRENRKKEFNDLYKKYVTYSKYTSAQKHRNKLLQITNSELCKELINLKEEVRKYSLSNSNLENEISDLSRDSNNLMDSNKGLYEILTTLHNDTVQFEKRIGTLLNNLDPEIQSSNVQNGLSMSLNGQVKNPKAIPQPPKTNFSRYNFKDCIYIQDLSPIKEENADINKLIKPSDITRRLGHRSKIPHPQKSSESLHEVHKPVIEEDVETNVVNCSSWSARTPDFEEEIVNLVEQSPIAEKGTTPNVGICNADILLSSPTVGDESNDMTADESKLSRLLPDCSKSRQSTSYKNENDSVSKESPLPSNNVIPSSDSEENDFRPSIFVNVFPRRRKNYGSSLSIGNVEEEGSEEHKYETVSDLMPEESIIENTCSDLALDVEAIALDIKYGAKTYAVDFDRIMDNQSLEVFSSTLPKEERIARDEIDLEESTLKESKGDLSFIGKQESPSKSAKGTTIQDQEISTSASKRKSNISNVEYSPVKRSSPNLSNCISKTYNFERKKNSSLGSKAGESSSLLSQSSKISLRPRESCKSVQDGEVKDASRTADRLSVKSNSGVTPDIKSLEVVEDAKKTLRKKKPINFKESPVNQKRKRKGDKAAK